MNNEGKPHDPGRDQRLKLRFNRARLNRNIIRRFKQRINRKARSPWSFTSWQATTDHGNAGPIPLQVQVVFCVSCFAPLVKGISSGGALWT